MDAAVWITGNVGSEVQLREFGEGVTFANFRLACTPRQWRRGQWGDEETTWLHVVCGKTLALNVKSSIGKGDPVVVVGRLRTERWTDQDGGRHERIKLDAQSVGHDLARGTSVFRRTPKQAQEEEPGVDLSALMVASEQEAASPAEETDAA